jgi:hypothetical protein
MHNMLDLFVIEVIAAGENDHACSTTSITTRG